MPSGESQAKDSCNVFDVTADGTLIYSKRSTALFPENDEVLQSLRGMTQN